jgi:hypothetical protein
LAAAVESSNKWAILVNGVFKGQSYVNGGVDTATTYKDFTIDFAK